MIWIMTQDTCSFIVDLVTIHHWTIVQLFSFGCTILFYLDRIISLCRLIRLVIFNCRLFLRIILTIQSCSLPFVYCFITCVENSFRIKSRSILFVNSIRRQTLILRRVLPRCFYEIHWGFEETYLRLFFVPRRWVFATTDFGTDLIRLKLKLVFSAGDCVIRLAVRVKHRSKLELLWVVSLSFVFWW